MAQARLIRVAGFDASAFSRLPLRSGFLTSAAATAPIHNNHHHDAGAIGPLLFRQACLMGDERIVSKHRDSTYKAGPSQHWIKIKNPKSPAMVRAHTNSSFSSDSRT